MMLHLYQPPTQDLEVTDAILKSCYLPLLKILSQKSGFGLTLNISGSLILQLHDLGANEFFDLVKNLINDGKVEVVNSAIYHPLLPIIPEDVVTRQIEKNSQALKIFLGIKTTNGFFPPELGINGKVINLINSNYIFVDESAVSVKSPIVKYGKKYLLMNNRKVCDLLREYPKRLPVEKIVDLIKQNCSDDGLIVTVNDGELFGHHYSERLEVLSELLNRGEIKFIKASEAINRFGMQAPEISKIFPSTWLDHKDFSMWNKNALQKEYLKLQNLIYKSLQNNSDTLTLDLFDRGTSSCYLYWLSNWPWWHPALVQKGAERLIECTKDFEAHKIYEDFLDKMWKYHRSGKVEINYKEYDKKYKKMITKKYA